MAPNESTWVWMAGKIEGSKEGMKAIAVGQILSLLVTCSGLTSAVLARRGVDAPTTQSLFNYILLALVYGSLLIYRGKRIQISWYIYLILAFLDVEGNYLAVKAYQYTSITSVMLLDCWTIPCVLLLTWLALKTRYAVSHFVGVAICVGGLVMVIFSDVHATDRSSSGSNVILGDSLVICASMFYAISNVSEEFVVKKVDQVEFLAHIGMFGAVISACQLLLLELDVVRAIHWSVSSIAPFVGFALSIFAFSSLVPQLLRMNGSTMFNLSLLTSDMWAVAVRALGFHESVDSLYFVAFGLVVVGLVVYAVAGEPSPSPKGGSILSGERYKQVDQVDVTADALVGGELACLPNVDEEQQADGAAMDENAPLTSVAV
jgi:solute carrier family 35 protein F1/2